MEIKIYVWGGWYSSGAIESLVLIDNIRFDSEQKLTPSILNTSFENGMQGWSVDSYTYAGRYNPSKCLILEEYAGIKPTDGNKMLALMTNEENVADIYMYQTIYIPKNVSAITFDYNVLDSFDADNFASVGNGSRLCVRQDKDFNYTFSAFNRGVYGGCEHYCGGKIWGSTPLIYAEDVTINGCDNVYMSGWQEGVYDVTELAGSTVKFQLDFSDARRSDYVYASLILIDNIRFVYDGEEEGFKPVSDEYDSQIVRATVREAKISARIYVSKKYLIDIGWKEGDVSDKEVESLNRFLQEANITNKTSIMFLLATVLHESANGLKTVEDYNPNPNNTYCYNNRGVGYIQLTGATNHRAFLDTQGDKFSTGDDSDSADYIDEHYDPWQPTVFYWSVYISVGDNKSLNEYICEKIQEGANIDGLFLVVQYFVNGFLQDNEIYNEDTGNLLNPNDYDIGDGSLADYILRGIRSGDVNLDGDDPNTKDEIEATLHCATLTDGTSSTEIKIHFRAPINWEARKDCYEKCSNAMKQGANGWVKK